MPLLATREEKDSYINDIASKMSYVDIRKKGRVDISGILAVVNHFQSYDIKFDISESAHKIPSVLEEFSITDIYYNGYRIDVITALQDSVAAIPKKHFEYDITPDFYYVINLQSDLTTFETLGYLSPEDVLKAKSDSNFYYPKEFASAKELIEIIQKPKEPKNIIGNHRDCETLMLRFLDKELSYSYKKSFIRHIMSCPECLKKLSAFDGFNNISKSITDYPELTEKFYKKATGKLLDDDKSINVKSKIQDIFINTKYFVKDVFKKMPNVSFKNEIDDVEIPQNEKEYIDFIFNEENQKEKFKISSVLKRRRIGAMILIPVLLAFFIVFGVIKSVSNSKEQELPQEEFVDDDFQQTAPLGKDFSQMWDGEMSEPAEITEVTNQVNKVSWEIPKKLANDETYIKFLQIAGKNVQINLQNDLLMVKTIPTNRSIKVNVSFKNYGSIVSLKTVKGSGISEIDDLVEKTIFNAFSYVRPPQTNLKNIDLTLLIEL